MARHGVEECLHLFHGSFDGAGGGVVASGRQNLFDLAYDIGIRH